MHAAPWTSPLGKALVHHLWQPGAIALAVQLDQTLVSGIAYLLFINHVISSLFYLTMLHIQQGQLHPSSQEKGKLIDMNSSALFHFNRRNKSQQHPLSNTPLISIPLWPLQTLWGKGEQIHNNHGGKQQLHP